MLYFPNLISSEYKLANITLLACSLNYTRMYSYLRDCLATLRNVFRHNINQLYYSQFK